MRFPASRSSFRIRLAPFDVLWAAASLPVALWLRDVRIGIPSQLQATELYCAIVLAASILTFLVFRIREGVVHHFSVHDALGVAKAVVVAELLTVLVTFSTVRMDGVPRSLPALHALILAAGLIGYRLLVRMRYDERVRVKLPDAHADNIVLIGATRLSSLYCRMIKAYAPHKHKIVAILDSDPKMTGKAVDGIRVVGSPEQLGSMIHEFGEHGIVVGRILVGGDSSLLSPQEMDAIERTCSDYNLTPEFIPSLAGLDNVQAASVDQPEEVPDFDGVLTLPAYFRYKRGADVVISVCLLIPFLPLMLLVAAIVLLDVGSPILFWQQRLGLGGRPFLLNKFRTLKTLYDERGLPIGTTDRISWIGEVLRKARLDELPQILNVLVGDMSLVGPRPLLPQDQPPNATVRTQHKTRHYGMGPSQRRQGPYGGSEKRIRRMVRTQCVALA